MEYFSVLVAAGFGGLALAVISAAPTERLIGVEPEVFGASTSTSTTPRRSGRVEPSDVSREDFTAPSMMREARLRRMAKRLFDIVAALALLLFLSPIILATALAIKLDSRGPVFYRQTRVGLGGRPFRIWKFRSMRIDAESGGARWAEKHDSRVTRVGRIIRRVRIDEIPQAFNILSGDMSLIGPRPERPEFVAILEREIENYDLRHVVKPGVTGWAQVKFEYGASVEDAREKLRYDLFYIKNQSLAFDLVVALKTVRVALFGVGSR